MMLKLTNILHHFLVPIPEMLSLYTFIMRLVIESHDMIQFPYLLMLVLVVDCLFH